MSAAVRPGSVVAWWDGHALAFGLVAGEDKQRVRLVLRRGQEERVPPSRIAVEVTAPARLPGASLEERRQAGERIAAVEQRVRQRAGSVEVGLLWEIVAEGQIEDQAGSAMGIGELCELALSSTLGEDQAALILALLDDGVHFVRKGDGWAPRGRRMVGELKIEREHVARREAETRKLFSALAEAARGGVFCAQGSEVERRYVGALEQLAARNDQAEEVARTLALEALAAAGVRFDTPGEGAFRLLRRIDRFSSDDENLQPLRFGLRTEFPVEVLEHSERLVNSGGGHTRRDLTFLAPITIDGPQTSEIDDALSIERLGQGAFRVGVHIADPGTFVVPGDPVDREALTRSLTYYMPDLRLPMLPPAISEQAASLVQGQPRPALSFLVDVDAQGRVAAYELALSTIRSSARLDYTQADRVIRAGGDHGEQLCALAELARLRQHARALAGAVTILAPEVEPQVEKDGSVHLDRLDPDSPSRRAVTEAMILAGEVAALFCKEAGLTVIYRRQAAPALPLDLPPEGVSDPVAVRHVRLSLKRAEVGLAPGLHASLGLPAYTQVTSPIRRFQDLATQRQISAHLRGLPPAYDIEAMQRIAATTEQAEHQARRAERAADEYWLLRYLENQAERELEAVVLGVEPRPVVQLVETLWEQTMNGLTGVEPGQRIRVRVERINPRAGLLGLRHMR